MSAIASVIDFERLAKRRLPRFLYDYAAGGAFDELTLRSNTADLRAVALRQRVLADIAEIDTSTRLFDRAVPLPLALAPIGIGGMYRRRGETQAARAANARGLPFTISTVALCGIEEIARAAPGPLWFQLYVLRDRGFMRELIARAKAVGAEALVFTVDMPVPGTRWRDVHSGLSGKWGPVRRTLQAIGKPGWAWDVGLNGRPHRLGNLEPLLGKASGMSDYMAWLAANFDPSIQWRDLDWIRRSWDGPLIIKGVLDASDARAAAEIGAQGIVVSNHGGRQLDGVVSSARALPPIVDAVGHRLTVLADSGVKTGLDVVRLLALGARGVLLGRAWLWALAAKGEAGVANMLDLIGREMRVAMALIGVNSIAKLDRSALVA